MTRSPGQSTVPGPPPPPPPPTRGGTVAHLSDAPKLGRAERLSTRRYLRIQPIGRGAIILALLALVFWMILNAQALVSLALALLLALVVDGALALRALRFDTVDLTPADQAIANEPTRWHLHVDGVTRPTIFRAVRYPPGDEILITRDRPGIITLPPTPRGIVHFAVFDAVTTGPLGMCRVARRYRTVPREPVVVGPRSLPVMTRWPLPKAVSFGLNESAPRGDDLFRGIRPYQRGDERRKIHWKATARQQELMVREDDGTGIIALQVIVDLGGPGYLNEQVAANATWLTETAVQQGWIVQLVTLDDTPPVPQMAGLGKPLSRPPAIVPQAPRPPQLLAQTVTSSAAVRRQIATAAPGTPPAPRWSGLRCRVSVSGVDWA